MGLNNYPYTNFHEMNLDWILEAFGKEVYRIEQLEEFQIEAGQDISELQSQEAELRGYITALQTAQDYVNGRLNTDENRITALEDDSELLHDDINDLDSEISAINSWQTTTNATLISYGNRLVSIEEFIEDMAEGSLPQELINSLMQYVRDHLPELLTPLQTAITNLQTSMTTVQGNITTINNTLDTKFNAGLTTVEASANNITTAGVYKIDLSITTGGLPKQEDGILIVYRQTGNTGGNIVQIFVQSNGTMYSRYSYNGTTWTSWTDYYGLINDLTSVVANIDQSITNIEALGLSVPIPITKGGTGADNIADAMINLKNIVGSGVAIDDNENINSYFIPGVYRIRTNASASTMSNLPEASGGKLISMTMTTVSLDGTYATQFYFPNGKQYFYMRTQTTVGNITPWNIVGNAGILRITYNETSLDAITPKRLTISTTDVLSGANFGTHTANADHFTLPAGTYRITTSYRNNPTANAYLRSYIRTTTSMAPIITDRCSASAQTGDTASIVTLNGTDIFSISSSTDFYFIVYSFKAITSGGAGYVTIERL